MPITENLLGAGARRQAQIKQYTILSFLREDVYTVSEVIQALCGIQDQAATKTLRQMVKAGLLRRSTKKHIIYGGYRHVWGITSAGIERSLAADGMLDYWEEMDVRAFEESMVRKGLDHLFNIQKAKAEVLRKGGEWVGESDLEWCYAYDYDGVKRMRKGVHRPDGVATIETEGGLLTYAVEVEQEIKSAKNYRSNILPGHYRNIAEGRYEMVYYYRDNLTLCENLRRKLLGIAIGRPAKRDARGRPLPRPKRSYGAVETVFEYSTDDDIRVGMDLSPMEAFDRYIQFSDYEGKTLKDITEEEWARAYDDDFTA